MVVPRKSTSDATSKSRVNHLASSQAKALSLSQQHHKPERGVNFQLFADDSFETLLLEGFINGNTKPIRLHLQGLEKEDIEDALSSVFVKEGSVIPKDLLEFLWVLPNRYSAGPAVLSSQPAITAAAAAPRPRAKIQRGRTMKGKASSASVANTKNHDVVVEDGSPNEMRAAFGQTKERPVENAVEMFPSANPKKPPAKETTSKKSPVQEASLKDESSSKKTPVQEASPKEASSKKAPAQEASTNQAASAKKSTTKAPNKKEQFKNLMAQAKGEVLDNTEPPDLPDTAFAAIGNVQAIKKGDILRPELYDSVIAAAMKCAKVEKCAEKTGQQQLVDDFAQEEDLDIVSDDEDSNEDGNNLLPEDEAPPNETVVQDQDTSMEPPDESDLLPEEEAPQDDPEISTEPEEKLVTEDHPSPLSTDGPCTANVESVSKKRKELYNKRPKRRIVIGSISQKKKARVSKSTDDDSEYEEDQESLSQQKQPSSKSKAALKKKPRSVACKPVVHIDSNDDDELELCDVCKKGGRLLVCDGGDHQKGCGRPFHVGCVGREEVPDGDWICRNCAKTTMGIKTGIEGLEFQPPERELEFEHIVTEKESMACLFNHASRVEGVRRVGDRPTSTRQQSDHKVREKIQALRKPLEVAQRMSTAIVRSDSFDSSNTSSSYLAAREEEKARPWVMHMSACYTEQPENGDGQNRHNDYLDKPEFHFVVHSQQCQKKLESVLSTGSFKVVTHNDFGSFQGRFLSGTTKPKKVKRVEPTAAEQEAKPAAKTKVQPTRKAKAPSKAPSKAPAKSVAKTPAKAKAPPQPPKAPLKSKRASKETEQPAAEKQTAKQAAEKPEEEPTGGIYFNALERAKEKYRNERASLRASRPDSPWDNPYMSEEKKEFN